MARRLYIAGAGYVGLVTGALYAQKGNLVSIYEKDDAKREVIASGKTAFFEPGLDELLTEVIQNGQLEVVEHPAPAVASSDFSFVAVGTPGRKDGSANLSGVLAACRDIGRGLSESSGYHVVVIRSTVFPGTTAGILRQVVEKVSGKRAGRDFGLVAYPEFLREGSAIGDMLRPDRIVLGGFDSRSGNALEALIREFYGVDVPPLLRVSPATAEMIKYASNAFLATKVAFINEIADLCGELQDVDVDQVADGMGYDHRIGRAFLYAGLGFGGSCLPKDLRALIRGARRCNVRLRIAEATLASNELQPTKVIRLARKLMRSLKGKQAAVLGLAFKPGTNDMREAPSIKIVRALLKGGMRVSIYDPAAMETAVEYFGNRVRYAGNIRDCLRGADCCFVTTEWDEFKVIPSDLFVEAMARPILIDGRRVFEPSNLDPRITYTGIGLGKHEHD